MKAKVIILSCLIFTVVKAETHYVPEDFSSIQNAIDASTNGDTIIVSTGVYFENINFNGKSITVT